jgi:hypothetical protein
MVFYLNSKMFTGCRVIKNRATCRTLDGWRRASSVGKKQFNTLHVARVNEWAFSQGAFALPGLGGQDMAAIGLVVRDFPGSGLLESLGRRTVGFDLGHMPVSFAAANVVNLPMTKQMA